MTKRIENVFKISITAIFIMLCALLPSWLALSELAETPPDDPVMSSPVIDFKPLEGGFSARAALFNEYSYKKVEFDSDELDAATLEACNDYLVYIFAELTVDMNSEVTADLTGIKYYTVTDDNGRSIRLMEYYCDWSGDWKNWIDLYIDVDTGYLYYLYMSSECLRNHRNYEESLPNHATFIEFMSGYTGYALIGSAVSYDDKGHTTITCTFGDSEQNAVYTYDVNGWGYFDEQEPASLFDYRILCKPDTNTLQKSSVNDATN